ncbi:MAG: HPr family phosphocarrier protein [Brevinematales bacterium]|nr:HPr family phosphocarrier protein [Brevinematales bacterium]
MKQVSVTISNEYGLHARPASLLANTASQFTSEIRIIKEGKEVNAKSIMNLLLLAAGKDTVIIVSADGSDESDALEAIRFLIEERKFDEK